MAWTREQMAARAAQISEKVVERLVAHLREAKRMGCDLVVFPELTLTTFFPRWYMTDHAEIDAFFEAEMPSKDTAPLFAEAQKIVGAELAEKVRAVSIRLRAARPAACTEDGFP